MRWRAFVVAQDICLNRLSAKRKHGEHLGYKLWILVQVHLDGLQGTLLVQGIQLLLHLLGPLLCQTGRHGTQSSQALN